jgi:hypothetical protein
MLTLLNCGQGQNGVAFDTDYQAVLNRATTLGYNLPSASQQIKQNTLLLALKAGGIWNKLDVLYIFANDGGSSFATLNWKNPNVNLATLPNVPTFITNQGFTGNTTSSYINTNFNPATSSGINYTLNNASRYIFVRNQDVGSTANTLDGAIGGNSNATLGINTSFLRINQGATSPVASGNYAGSNVLKSIHRTSVSNIEVFTGLTQSSLTFNSTSILSSNQLILARGIGATPAYGGSQVSMYSMGASLVAENTAYVNAFNTYITSLI